MSKNAQKRIRIKRVKTYSDTNWLKRIVYLALASISLISLSACKNQGNNNPIVIPTSPIETPAESPEPTPTEIVIETPTPTEFSYESVFSEIFSDEELSKLYPSIEDFDKERERIYSNISRIEDFEFYQLTEEEQTFIKDAQLGNIQESDQEKLTEVLTKTLQNDPYVFDDVDNEVKIDNRVNDIMLEEYKKINVDTSSDPRHYDSTKEILTVCNCGNIENGNTDEPNIIYDINASTNFNMNYFYNTVLLDYKSNNWRGNYNVFDFSKFLLDGSEGQKIAKKLYEANVKFFNTEKKDVKNGLQELFDESMNILIVNDALGIQGGINSLNSKMHYAIIYRYCNYTLFTIPLEMNPNIIYNASNEFAEKVGLMNSELSLKDIENIMEQYLGSIKIVYTNAFAELEESQEKYGNQDFQIMRREEIKN